MDVTRETPLQTEHRLRFVLAASTLEIQLGAWSYQELSDIELASRARPDALALVRHARAWSQLVPLADGAPSNDALAVWTFEFPRDAPNSGFVGWLATRIKERTGAGVVVACGYEEARAGVYDHWGCPWGVRSEVLELIQQLRAPGASPDNPLDDVLMRAEPSGRDGLVAEPTLFHFRQEGDRVRARYAGGPLDDGYFCGNVVDGRLSLRFVHRGPCGTPVGGEARCRLERTGSGSVRVRGLLESLTDSQDHAFLEVWNP